MRVVRYQAGGDAPQYGWLHEDKVGAIQGDVFAKYRRHEAKTPLADVRLLPPAMPTKIICAGRNYVEHAKELGNDVPRIPLIFMKPPSSAIGPGDAILLPPQSSQVEHEAELVAVIGKRGRHIVAEEAKNHVFGYTAGNDVTARDLQKSDDQWTRAKGFDTFCAFGPWIDTEFDASDAVITCKVNGQPRQMASTRDVVLKAGDEVVVEIEGLGVLRNPVRAEST
jgi:2-keto-4-pentenoate hydratase/2-oxohepta-3-ene-1,7-dioic acid hydratase in catechol pathway